jgi:O-acetyl-ADP-ribose deacetylase (regulator of RNase III)
MLEFKTGDILAEEAEALVNTVNCVGVMGRGIALQFKKMFPENFKAYAAACKHNEVQPGRLFVYETGFVTNPRLIVNFPTKRHWRGKSRIEDIEAGLRALAELIRDRGIESIAIPPLGAGLGGLDWREVRQRVETTLGQLSDVRVIVFEPHGSPDAADMARSRKVPEMTPGRAALVALMDRYLRGLLDPFVSLLEVHKLMYFLQEAGEPLRLRYSKGPYGPYSENLRHVLNAVEGHLISGFADGGENPGKQLNLVPGALDDAERELASSPETRNHLDSVFDLVDGFESPYGLELLSTVHWVWMHESARTEGEVIAGTYAWNERKRQFTERQIKLAAGVLTRKGWGPGHRGVQHEGRS